jgi:dTDP-4-dehydrorhamnose reductase
MKILLTGCRGQLGLALCQRLDGTPHSLVATDLHNLDITNSPQVDDCVRHEAPQVIINCAALTDVDACEQDEQQAFRVNALGPRNLAVAAQRIGAAMLQISTDYVFSGADDLPRREYDPVSPCNKYGQSKAWGEELVRGCNSRNFVVRTAWLYGEGKNFVQSILKAARERDELAVVTDQVGTPTSARDLSEAILRLIETREYGTYHAVNEGHCSRFEQAAMILTQKGIRTKLKPVDSTAFPRPAQRPAKVILENFMLDLSGIYRFRSWQEALAEYLNKQL